MRRLALPVAALALALTACTGQPASTPSAPAMTAAPASTTQSQTAAPTGLRAVTDPTAFDASRAIALRTDVGPVQTNDAVFGDRTTIAGTTLFGLTRAGHLVRVPLALGEASWSLPVAEPTATPTPAKPAAPWGDDKGPSAPVVSGDGATVYAAVGTMIWGPQDKMGVAVVAIDSVTGRERWRQLLSLKTYSYDPAAEMVRTSLTSNGLLVSAMGESVLLDPASGKVTWQVDGLVALGNGRMGVWAQANVPNRPLYVFDAATGKQTDTKAVDAMSYWPVYLGEANGAAVFQVTSGTPVLLVLDPASGTVRSKHAHWSFRDCRPLEKGSTRTLCTPGGTVNGVDVMADKALWTIDTKSGPIPSIPSRHGDRVYGRLAGKGVAYDLATGRRLSEDTGAPVFHVTEYGGLAFGDKGLLFVPAKG